MKILFVNRGIGVLYGGGESFDYNAAKYLRMHGHDITILTARSLFKKNVPVLERDDNLEYVRSPFVFRKLAYKISNYSILFSAFFFKVDELLFGLAILRWLNKNVHKKFDLIQILSLTWLAKKIISKFNIPCVSWLPGIPGKMQQQDIKSMIGQRNFSIFTHGAPVIFLKKVMKINDFAEIPPGIELDRINEIKQSLNKKDFRNQIGIKEDDIVGITVARLIPVKNLSFLINTLQKIMENYPNYKHLIVGNGPMKKQLERLVSQLKLEGKVIFIGSVPNDEVHKFLSVSDLFVLTSIYESFSIALLEAMANNIPVIVPDVGYIGIIVRLSNGGKIIEPNNVKQLYEALKFMIENKTKRVEFGNNGRKYAEQFDWPIIAKRLETLYYKLVNQ
ncbi:MAG: glycosyltransferase family 4 protein [bacterium]